MQRTIYKEVTFQFATEITYQDGEIITLDRECPELDLSSEHGKSIFSILVRCEGEIIFSAYHWENNPYK